MNLVLEILRNHGIKELYERLKDEVQGYDKQFFNNLIVLLSLQLSFHALGGNDHIDESSTYNTIFIAAIMPVIFGKAMLLTSSSFHMIPEKGKLETAKHYLRNITAGLICGATSFATQQGVRCIVSSFLTSSTIEQHDQAIEL